MKQALFLILNILVTLAASAQEVNGDIVFEQATDAIEHMRVGWNLGNTLDCNSGDTLHMWIEDNKGRTPYTYETAWGQRVTRPALFKMLRQAGFNAIRIPVTWYPHMEATFNSVHGYDDNGTWRCTPWLPSQDDIGQKVQKTWMQRVHQIVDYVINEGMYCIINIHHDTGEANTAWLLADEALYEAQHERFEALWTQIAEEFRDYDEHLLFEGYNEMLDVKRSWCFASFGASGNYDAAIATSAYNAINAYAQSFVNAVRATGGNNSQRNLIVSTYGACDGNGTWNSHLQDPLKQMKLPKDPADGHLIFEVHSYPDITNLSSAKSGLNTTIANMKRYLVQKGAPVIFGEWGIFGGGENRENHIAYVKYFAQRAKANKMGLFYWMGLTDGSHRTVPEFNEPDLVDAMMTGFYGENGYVDDIQDIPVADKTIKGKTNVYDLSGKQVPRPKKGLYIINGNKRVIR